MKKQKNYSASQIKSTYEPDQPLNMQPLLIQQYPRKRSISKNLKYLTRNPKTPQDYYLDFMLKMGSPCSQEHW